VPVTLTQEMHMKRARKWFLSLEKGGQSAVAAAGLAAIATAVTAVFTLTGSIASAAINRPPAPTATVTVTATTTVTATVTATPQITIINNVVPAPGPAAK
jgi:predicted deacylase